MGLSSSAALALAEASAQGTATPGASPMASPVGGGKAIKSITRDEYNALLREQFAFEAPASTGGTLIRGESSDIQTVNPIVYSDSYSGRVIRLMFNFLAKTSVIDGMPVPDLADYWVQEADGVTYTFTINPDATWHDGEPVTADDCVFSFDVTMDEDTPSVRRGSVQQVLKEWRKVDEKTFQLVAREPTATFIGQTAGLVGIIPKHIWESVSIDEMAADAGSTGQDASRVIGSGPFRFAEWDLGDHVRLIRNDEYWDPDAIPVIDEFIYQVVAETTSLTQSLVTGNIDMCSVEFTDVATLQDNQDIHLDIYDTLGCNWFDMMLDPARNELFVDREVRQAMMYALDRDLIAETIYQGFAVRADGTLPPLSIAYDPSRIDTIYTQDQDRAKELLEEAGWVDSDGDGIVEKDGTKLSFKCHYSEGSAIYTQQLPYMQQAWRDIGIDMQPTAVPFPTLSEMGASGDYQMRVRGFTWDVEGSQGVVFRCDAVETGFNSMHYCNPEFDQLDVEQLSELDVDKRIDLLLEQANLLNEDVAAGFLVFRKGATGALSSVKNYFPNGYDDMWSINWVWKDE